MADQYLIVISSAAPLVKKLLKIFLIINVTNQGALRKNKNSHDFLKENFYKFITNHQQYMLITIHVLTKCLHVGWPGSWWYAVG